MTAEADAFGPLIALEPPTAEELDEERKRSRLKKLGGLLVPVALLASKGKVLLLGLAKVKAVTTLGTMRSLTITAARLPSAWAASMVSHYTDPELSWIFALASCS